MDNQQPINNAHEKCVDCELTNRLRSKWGLSKKTVPFVKARDGVREKGLINGHFCISSKHRGGSVSSESSNHRSTPSFYETTRESSTSRFSEEKENRQVTSTSTLLRVNPTDWVKPSSSFRDAFSDLLVSTSSTKRMRLCEEILASNPDVRIDGRECLKDRVNVAEYEQNSEGDEEASTSESTSRKRKLPTDEYEVDKILAVWFDKFEPPSYLIKWSNYPYEVSTWEMRANVKNCTSKKLEYSKRQQLRLLIAQQLERDEEKNYFRSDGAHLYASPAFFACHRWEDEVNEITKASGQAPIYIENWVDAAGRPKKFTFIVSNIIPAETQMLFVPPAKLSHCKCVGDCGKTDCCPDIFEQKFAYTCDSRIRRNFSEKNHIVECSDDCACGPNCETKVVRRGRKIPVVIFRTLERGWGIRTAERVKANSFMMEYLGVVLGVNSDAAIKNKSIYQFDMRPGVPDQKQKFVVDATNYGNEARFVNHSCDPNMYALCVFADRFDTDYQRIVYFAARDIEKGEELTINYFAHMDKKVYDKRTRNRKKNCLCAAPTCKGFLV